MNIFPSTLIISKSSTVDDQISEICHNLDNKITPNNPDILVINQDTGWSIDLVRQTRKFLSQKPFCHSNKIIIIYQAENLNTESQNALLKTLEEPGPDNYVILSTSKQSKLLPTIISRCQIIKLNNKTQIIDHDPFKVTHNIQKDLLVSESLSKDKTQVLPYLKNQLIVQQRLLISKPSQETSKLIQKIIRSIQMIESNVDPKSALDFLFLS